MLCVDLAIVLLDGVVGQMRVFVVKTRGVVVLQTEATVEFTIEPDLRRIIVLN